MAEFLQGPTAAVIFLLALAAMLIAIGAYAIGKFRSATRDAPPVASELITNFQNLHSQGGLSDEEYRTIKSVLTERLQGELNSTADSG